MGRWNRAELEEAFDKFQAAALKGASTGDWEDWVLCFTPDATYIECADGNFWGRESIRKWIYDLMTPWPACEMTAFPVAWYSIDEDKGWIIAEVRNRMNDIGDGRIYEEVNMTILKYAGRGMFSSEVDTYNPLNFKRMFGDWVKARLERAEPKEREELMAKLQVYLKQRAEVDKGGIGAIKSGH